MKTLEKDTYTDGTLEITDKKSSQQLQVEIDALIDDGIETRVVPSHDEAYRRRQKITEVYGWLEGIDNVIESRRCEELGAYACLGIDAAAKKFAGRKINGRLDDIRAEYLYDIVEARPWWNHGGSALALGTIVDAFQLRTVDDERSGYHRMSGRIDDSILKHQFDETVPELSGMSLEQAVSHAYRYFGPKGIILQKPSQFVRDHVAHEKIAKLDDFVHAQNTESFMDVVRYCQDGIGIRERATIVNNEMIDYVAEKDIESPLVLSLGSGTTFPMLDGVEALVRQGKTPHLIAVDQDPLALAAAQQEIERRQLGDYVELHCRRVFNATGKTMDFDELLQGRKPDIIENSGFREYVPDGVYDKLLKTIRGHLNEGGLSINCCTNQNRPQKRFLYGAMGWPVDIRCCRLQEMVDAIEKSGFPASGTKAAITQSGVYTAFSSIKY